MPEVSGGEADRRFQALLELAPDAIVLVDPAGQVVLANRRTVELFGYAMEELVGQSVEVLMPERFRGVHAAHRTAHVSNPRALATGPAIELFGRRKDGSEFPVEITLSPLDADRDELVTTVIRDLTDRRAAEAERLELARAQAATAEAVAATARLREILGDLDAIVWESDTATRERFTFISSGAEALLGHPAEAWTDGTALWPDLVHVEDRERVLATSREALAERRHHELEYRATAADGRTVWLRDMVRVTSARPDGSVYLRGVMVDVTERRDLEARLLQSQKMDAIGQLAGGVAHDFNNLLTVISGYADLLAVGLARDADRQQLAQIQEAAEHARVLTRQLLTFSHRGPQVTELVDLNELIARLEQMLRRLIDENVQLSVLLTPGALLARMERGQFEQVIVNLVVNARDAMPCGGALRITTSREQLDAKAAAEHGVAPGGYFRLVVSDSGEGMSPETLERVFEPFFTTKEPGKGTGLGLATAYGIVDRAGGTIRATSEPGRGTDIAILLPAAGILDGPRSEATEPPRPTVLVAEDEPALRNLMREVLEGDGYRVLEAANGAEALEVLRRSGAGADLLVTDVVMPGLSGPQLVAELAVERPDLKVLYVSGHTDSRLAGWIAEDDVNLLHKPFLPHELRRRVGETLAGKA